MSICTQQQIRWAWKWQWHLAPTSWHQVSLSSSVLPWKHFCQSLTVTWQQDTNFVFLLWGPYVCGNTACYMMSREIKMHWFKQISIKLVMKQQFMDYPLNTFHLFTLEKLLSFSKKKTRYVKPLKFPFLIGRVFRGLWLPGEGFLRRLQHRLSRSDPVTDWPFCALNCLGRKALRVQAARGERLANILSSRHVAWKVKSCHLEIKA